MRGVVEQGSGAVVVAEDVTAINEAQSDRPRRATAIDQAAEAIVVTDPDGLIVYANPAFERITGYARAELLGQNPRVLKSGAHEPAYYERLWATLLAGETWRGEYLYSRASTIYGGTAEVQRNIIARRLLELGSGE